MKKRTLVIMGTLLLAILLFGCSSSASQSTDTTGNAVAEVATVSADGYQDIALSYGHVGPSFNYIISPSIVKVNIPVRVTADVTNLKGCYRYLNIPKVGVKKYLTSEDNIVEFTPTETGELIFTCSMGMGNAKLTVE